jgi:cytochrome c-type biogenesis protein CcmH
MTPLWIILTLLMLVTAGTAAWPFVMSPRRRSGSESTVYLAQLKEIDREESLGLLPPDDAKLARLEIKRRLAGTEQVQDIEETSTLRRSDQITLVAFAVSIAVGSALIYSIVGDPGIPSAARRAITSAEVPVESGSALGGAQNGVGSVDEMISRLEARLETSPDDVEGWRMLGWSRFRTGDVEGARQAYQKAIDLEPDDAQTLSALGEAQIRVAGGFVNDTALANLKRAVELDPNDPRARFLLGLRKEQDGDAKGALDEWIALVSSADDGADWQNDVRTRILELSADSGIDVAGRLPEVATASTAGPTLQDVSAASQMSPEEREAMIEAMVSRLDQRLREAPSDRDGWVRLIRARRVLGQEAEARDALARAKAFFSNDGAAMSILDEAATSPLDNTAN